MHSRETDSAKSVPASSELHAKKYGVQNSEFIWQHPSFGDPDPSDDDGDGSDTDDGGYGKR